MSVQFIFSVVEGCDPNHQVVKAKGKTAMHAAAAGGYVDIMACLRLVNNSKQLHVELQKILKLQPEFMTAKIYKMFDTGF